MQADEVGGEEVALTVEPVCLTSTTSVKCSNYRVDILKKYILPPPPKKPSSVSFWDFFFWVHIFMATFYHTFQPQRVTSSN